MQSEPGCSASTSSREVCGFMQTIRSTSFLRAIHPSLFARIVNQVGRPAMFEGNMFLPLTGTPIWKMERIRTLLDDWDPDPLTVATWIVKSLTTGAPPDAAESSTASAVRVSVTSFSLWVGFHLFKEEANCTPEDFSDGRAGGGERRAGGQREAEGLGRCR